MTTNDLNRIAVFCRVVETGSFTAAATALSVPKSSVSRAVSHLEAALGARLLHRTTRKLNLTDAGRSYYERVSRALAGIDEANQSVADMQASVSGVIRLTAPPDIGVWILAEMISEFRAKHPRISVESYLSNRIVDLVEEGIDLAVRAGPLRDSSLVARRIDTGNAVLFAAARYLKKRGTPRSVADLANHDCVGFRPVGGRVRWELSGPSGVEVVELAGTVSADDFSFVHRAVVAGAGIGLLPWFFCSAGAARDRLVRVLPDYVLPMVPLHLVYPAALYLPQRVAMLRDFLVSAFSALVKRSTP